MKGRGRMGGERGLGFVNEASLRSVTDQVSTSNLDLHNVIVYMLFPCPKP